jgi:hypothetical protein
MGKDLCGDDAAPEDDLAGLINENTHEEPPDLSIDQGRRSPTSTSTASRSHFNLALTSRSGKTCGDGRHRAR